MANWYYPEDEAVDVAVLYASVDVSEPDKRRADYKILETPGFVTDELIKEEGIGIGDDLITVGLFAHRYGKQRNLPIVRSGIISSMPEEPLVDENTGLPYHAYLTELRSIGGLSGSPVFYTNQMAKTAFLLGMVRGHWDAKMQLSATDFDDYEVRDINTGIAIVTPIQEVAKLLKRDDLVKERRAADKEWRKRNAPKLDQPHSIGARCCKWLSVNSR